MEKKINEEEVTLKRLLQQGLSQKKISQQLGQKSRSVIGKIIKLKQFKKEEKSCRKLI